MANELELVIGSREREQRAITKVQSFSEFEDISVEEDWVIPPTAYKRIMDFAKDRKKVRIVMKMSGEWKEYFEVLALFKAKYPNIQLVWVIMGPMTKRLRTLGKVTDKRTKFKICLIN